MVTLEASKPFRNLKQIELSALRQIAREETFRAGQSIFQEGDNGLGVYVLKTGRVEISTCAAGNNRRVFAQIRPGELFGEMAVLELKSRSATATATEDSTVYFIPRNELLGMVERSPALALELLREISERLREFNRRYIDEILQTERLTIVGRFARSIVHDLKNPLNIIGLTAELTCMEKATADMRKQASSTIRKQVDRISEMVSEILDFTQGTSAETILATLDYGVFVQQLIDEIRPELELRNSKLHVSGLPNVRLPLNPKRLRRVFYNLLHNATEAMPGGGDIYLRFRTERDAVITEIEDTGSGIAPEIADKLFEVFATHGKAHGTGLGLSICKKIVEDHKGRIWAENKPGHGAVFAFSLPLSEQH